MSVSNTTINLPYACDGITVSFAISFAFIAGNGSASTPVYKITDFTFTSATEMQAVVGCKGGTAAAMAVDVDAMYCYQARSQQAA